MGTLFQDVPVDSPTCSYLKPIAALEIDSPEKPHNMVFKDKKLLRTTEELAGRNMCRGV